jgi:hypothetical protein
LPIMTTIVKIVRAISPVINDALMIEQSSALRASPRRFRRNFWNPSSFIPRRDGYYCDSAKIAVIRDTETIIHRDVLAKRVICEHNRWSEARECRDYLLNGTIRAHG